MGPFFYSKNEIPAKALQFKSFNFLRLFLEIPPKAIIFFLLNY